MNRFIRNEQCQYKVPFSFCVKCKKFLPFEYDKTCLYDHGCKEAIRLYLKCEKRGEKVYGNENEELS